jgi:hypothetical protein
MHCTNRFISFFLLFSMLIVGVLGCRTTQFSSEYDSLLPPIEGESYEVFYGSYSDDEQKVYYRLRAYENGHSRVDLFFPQLNEIYEMYLATKPPIEFMCPCDYFAIEINNRLFHTAVKRRGNELLYFTEMLDVKTRKFKHLKLHPESHQEAEEKFLNFSLSK